MTPATGLRWHRLACAAAAAACIAGAASAQPSARVDSVVWADASNATSGPVRDDGGGAGQPWLSTDARTALVVGAGMAGVFVYGNSQWWNDGFGGGFKTVDEGWFGADTPNGGADKLGHAYFSYIGVRGVSQLAMALGQPPERARQIGFWSTLGTMTAVEVLDGYSRNYAFNTADAIMNVVGAAAGYFAESYPEVDAALDFRLRYLKSDESSSWDPAGDYSGQTYFLVLKASGLPQLRDVPVVRYLEFAVGYGAEGYNPLPGQTSTPQRTLYVGLSINLAAILNDTVYRDGRWPSARKASDFFFDVWQIPYTGAYGKSRL